MNFNKKLHTNEYGIKETIGYYLVTYNAIKESNDKTLLHYIETIIENMERIEKKHILEQVDTRLFAYFPFYYTLNNKEIAYYAVVVFNTLLRTNKEFNEKDIISELEITMRFYTTRTIVQKSKKILEKIKNKTLPN